jgi:hypothetical protein
MRSPIRTVQSESIFFIINIVQNSKIRAVLNMSSPKGRSLNDAIDKLTVDNLNMSSPKLFVEFQTIRKRHTFLKKRYSRRLQIFGFKWPGKYFFDKTTENTVRTLYKIPKKQRSKAAG